jgi:putative ABC transport system permease protein
MRLALRTLLRRPGFTAASVLTLALGVFLVTIGFGLVNAAWFRPLPFRDAGRLTVVAAVNPEQFAREGVSYRDFRDLGSAGVPSVQGMAAFSEQYFNLNASGAVERTWGGIMTANSMAVLGIQPLLGRPFTPEEETSGAPVVMIGELMWRNRFESDPGIIGREIKVDGRPAAVVGIFPRTFRFIYADYDLLAPLPPAVMRAERSARSLSVVARLRGGAGPRQANAELQAVAARIAAEHPETNAKWTVDVTDYRDTVFRNPRAQSAVLLACSLLVLLIVCVNVSNLFLAHASSRRREIAIRMAIGARRFSIVRQLLAEALLISSFSAATALPAACWMREIVVARFPQLAFFEIDWRVFLFTLLICFTAAAAFALAPALIATRADVNSTLKSGGLASSPAGAGRLRSLLVVSELSLGLMLLAGTGLLVKTVWKLRGVNTGVQSANLLVGNVSLEGAKYAAPEQRERFWTSAAARIAAAPGVASATVSENSPLCYSARPQEVVVDGRAARPEGDYLQLATNVVGPGYFDVIGVRLLAGRRFHSADRPGSVPAAIVNQALARKLWQGPPAAALGRRIRAGKDGEWLTVVGVVADARQSLTEPPHPEVFRPYPQSPLASMNFVARAASSPQAVKPTFGRAVRDLDPDLPVLGPSDMADLVENFYPMPMIIGIGLFAVVATLLAAVGLHGVIAFAVEQRTRELGVRMALGASRGGILRMVLAATLKLAAIGSVIGIGGAFLLARILEGSLQGVSPADPLIFVMVALALCLVAAGAGAAPAWRATRIDPMAALRCD